jgi:hypothetical protein
MGSSGSSQFGTPFRARSQTHRIASSVPNAAVIENGGFPEGRKNAALHALSRLATVASR